MRQKKEQNRGRYRKRKGGVDFINDSDDLINSLIQRMRSAAEEDRALNAEKQPALRKRKILTQVIAALRKSDLQMQLIENGIITAIAEWLSPLPDKSLPALEIRTELLKILKSFPSLEPETLRSSQVGKAVMYLCKHPKESRDNKQIAARMISEWARPIFNIQADHRSISKEEREQRDLDSYQTKRQRLGEENAAGPETTEAEKSLRPGDKGWIGRARVPRPSTKDYVVRPKPATEQSFKSNARVKKSDARLAQKMREFKDRTKQLGASHAVSISISGNKMNI